MQTISLSKPNLDLLIINLLEHTDSISTVVDIVYLAQFSYFNNYNEVVNYVNKLNDSINEQIIAADRSFYSSNNISMSV